MRRVAAILSVVVLGALLVAALLAPNEPAATPPGVETESVGPSDGTAAGVASARRARAAPAEGPEADDDEIPVEELPDASKDWLKVVVTADESEQPLAGATVTVERRDRTTLDATTDREGVATFASSQVDATSVAVSAPGRARRGLFATDFDGTPRGWWLGGTMEVRLERASAVRGRVIDAADGRPIAGAAVAATRSPSIGGMGIAGFDFEDRTTTAADGTFSFPGVPHARGFSLEPRVTVRHAGYVPASEALGAGAPPAAGELRPNDEVVVRLEREAALRGRVLLPDGSPAASAAVHLRDALQDGGWDENWNFDLSADFVADDDGRFAASGIATGTRLLLRAEADGLAPSEAISLVAGRETSQEVELRLRRRAALTVRVVGPTGADLPVCRVSVFSRRNDDGMAQAEGPSPIALDGLPPGRWALVASAEGCSPARLWADVPSADGGPVTIELGPAQAVDGAIVDDAGRPVPGVRVAAGPAAWEGKATVFLVRNAASGADGSFRVAAVAAGELVLDVDGRPAHERRVLPVASPASPVRVVVTRLGAAEVRLVAPEGSNLPETCGVYLAEGDEARAALPPWEGGAGVVHLNGTIAGDTLRVGGLPAGRRKLEICTSGFLACHVEVDVRPGETASVVDAVLDPGLAVEGRVVDAEGRGVPDVRVSSLGREWGSGVGDTRADGTFRMAPLAPGTHVLYVARPGAAARRRVEVTEGTPPVTLAMQRARRVRIRVLDVAGDPVPRAFVRIAEGSLDAPWWAERTWTDARGVATCERLPGSWTLRVLGDDGAPLLERPLAVGPVPPGDDPGIDADVVLPAK